MDDESLRRLVDSPTETLTTEMKRWLDLTTVEGQFHIVRSCMALRNNNGGQLLIGFDNKTSEPVDEGRPDNVREDYHPDTIQALVGKYSSHPFEVEVRFISRNGMEHPVLIVASGVRTPVAAKNPLVDKSAGQKDLFARGDVFVRTLSSSNVVGTSRARPEDWERLIEICFDNREADIGRFIRRQLGSLQPDMLQRIVEALGGTRPSAPSAKDRVVALLDRGLARYEATLLERKPELPKHGAWEVALIMEGVDPDRPTDRDFQSLIGASNPRYTGWAIWLDTSSMREAHLRPRMIGGAWEALIVTERFIEFQHMRADGEFYQRNALEEDLNDGRSGTLDPTWMIYRVAEAIAVGLAFAAAMKISDEGVLHFGFRWSGLKGRHLPPRWSYSNDDIAHDDAAQSFVTVRADTAVNAISPLVEQVLRPVLAVFNGVSLNSGGCEHWTQQLIERRL